ncbi:hypothetical protein BV22DRAFT_1039958 [Leucogyrophana mollusca]|uniref:Uncharacterized protein n=1 Tax=Leucogyrophana mollusca TaxID=85980 RepID=A0ACB8B4L9_9AGAM|nr:hypothetical protein BV22DRAFT_1039958 [Leucogyrophana mollusca]
MAGRIDSLLGTTSGIYIPHLKSLADLMGKSKHACSSLNEGCIERYDGAWSLT